nr:unnamed protein product [Spirometra erinaceieuropaei]
MPPGGLLSLRQTEEGVRQHEPVYCTGAVKKQAVVVSATETVGTQHFSPGSMVCADAGLEVTKDNQLVRLRHSRQECVQVLVELVLRGVGAGHRRSVGADDGGEFASPERQAEAHQAVVDSLLQTGQSSRDGGPDGESDGRVSSLCPGSTTPEEGVAGTHLLQLALDGESGLAECSDVHLVARQFPGH